jgi:hypothetical protein
MPAAVQRHCRTLGSGCHYPAAACTQASANNLAQACSVRCDTAATLCLQGQCHALLHEFLCPAPPPRTETAPDLCNRCVLLLPPPLHRSSAHAAPLHLESLRVARRAALATPLAESPAPRLQRHGPMRLPHPCTPPRVCSLARLDDAYGAMSCCTSWCAWRCCDPRLVPCPPARADSSQVRLQRHAL